MTTTTATGATSAELFHAVGTSMAQSDYETLWSAPLCDHHRDNVAGYEVLRTDWYAGMDKLTVTVTQVVEGAGRYGETFAERDALRAAGRGRKFYGVVASVYRCGHRGY
jgi:hypothetical protein